jgi:predicted neutral ceramidase superfamily lipid hydrolase
MTGIFMNKLVRYPFYIIGIGFLIYSVIFIFSFLLADPTEWTVYLFLATGLICLFSLSLLRRLNLTKAEYVLYFMMLCYIPNTVFCVVVFMFDWGLNIGGYIALISVLYLIAEIAHIVWRHRKSVQQLG